LLHITLHIIILIYIDSVVLNKSIVDSITLSNKYKNYVAIFLYSLDYKFGKLIIIIQSHLVKSAFLFLKTLLDKYT